MAIVRRWNYTEWRVKIFPRDSFYWPRFSPEYFKTPIASPYVYLVLAAKHIWLVHTMALRVVEFSRGGGGTKLGRLLHKNHHIQRKSLNFEFWINGKLSNIGHHSSDLKFISSKNVNNKKCAPNSSMKKKKEKISDNFWLRKLTLKVKLWHFLTPPQNSQNSIIQLGMLIFRHKYF